jgi:hypothetical protein
VTRGGSEEVRERGGEREKDSPDRLYFNLSGVLKTIKP